MKKAFESRGTAKRLSSSHRISVFGPLQLFSRSQLVSQENNCLKEQILPTNSEAWERITLHSLTIFHVFLPTFQLLSERVLIFTFYYTFFQSLTVRDVKPKFLGMRKCEELENLFSKTRWKLTSAGFQERNSLQANPLPEREGTVFLFLSESEFKSQSEDDKIWLKINLWTISLRSRPGHL